MAHAAAMAPGALTSAAIKPGSLAQSAFGGQKVQTPKQDSLALPHKPSRSSRTSVCAQNDNDSAYRPRSADNASSSVPRRSLLAAAGAVAAAQLPLVRGGSSAFAADDIFLPDWETVPLPVEPGVVLLDIAFVPGEPDHGFLLGTRQTLLETKDGGKSWTPRSVSASEDEEEEESAFNYRFNSISFAGQEGWIVGKPAILLHTTDGGGKWERVPLSARLPGTPVLIQGLGDGGAEMVTDEGAIYRTQNGGKNWRAAVEETVSATLNRTVSSGISGASYYTGTFSTINRADDGSYVAVSSRGNFYLTWQPGQPYWQPHNRNSARRIQNMGWRADGGLWLLVRGGGLFLSKGTGVDTEEFEEVRVSSRGYGILDIGYKSEDEAWAAGGSGVLLKTTDGGKTWAREKAAEQIAANLYSVKFLGDKGFVLGNDGVLLRYLA